ncbi:GFP-like non-fluorescent chromoprotein isoform X1 [Xenia sp. Carnegie-2017]|uniref:GFP-like non-fluorescent chromoprotein isoform X1 n=1 Tax=Xenia sp. Carnegie-2017 TaxID=2897299 RepID=UPI001F03C6A8|nr:GFP-like non-fluorescent chromoprotein isoform X1 [Xenia sp. Carnegie-2017]
MSYRTGNQMVQIRITKGGPLPFSFDILSVCFQYGNRIFTKYPKEIPSYFRQCFPAGFTMERSLRFEDGGCLDIRSDVSLFQGKFVYKIECRGENFPSDGPIMSKSLLGLQPSFETVFARNSSVVGEVILSFKLKQGKHHTCHMKTLYRSKQPVSNMPNYHFIQHRLEKTNVSAEGNYIEQHETAIAQNSSIRKPIGSLYYWSS